MLAIRDADELDIDFLAALQAEEMRRERPDSDSGTLRRLAVADTCSHLREPPEGSVLSVIELDGRPVGRLRVVRKEAEVFLAGIQLSASERNHGIGSRIIGRLLDEARSRKLPLRLRVHRKNLDAQRLYARLGFERYDQTETELLMSCR